MLRIDVNGDTEGYVQLRLSGQLSGPWVQELSMACEKLRHGSASKVLDLTQLEFADHSGQRLLKELRESGFALRGFSPFLAAQLAETPSPEIKPAQPR